MSQTHQMLHNYSPSAAAINNQAGDISSTSPSSRGCHDTRLPERVFSPESLRKEIWMRKVAGRNALLCRRMNSVSWSTKYQTLKLAPTGHCQTPSHVSIAHCWA